MPVPGSQATFGLGRVSGVDQETGVAYQLARDVDVELVAAIAIPIGCLGRGVVAGAAVEPEENAPQRVGRGTLVWASPTGNAATCIGVAGKSGSCGVARGRRRARSVSLERERKGKIRFGE